MLDTPKAVEKMKANVQAEMLKLTAYSLIHTSLMELDLARWGLDRVTGSLYYRERALAGLVLDGDDTAWD